MIGGVQKGGTTALAHYLSAHPGVRLPARKEAHVFDAADFDEAATAGEVDARFAPMFPGGFADGDVLYGDATPISIFHNRFIERIARYNPAMRWIVLLREPADRAISQYYMERGRGDEHRCLPLALLTEGRRLRGHENDFSAGSPLRHHSYLARGRYVRQLDTLVAAFPREQVLVLRSEDLRAEPGRTLDRVLCFLGLPPFDHGRAFAPVFAGDWHGRWLPRLLRPWIVRLYRGERVALRTRYGISFSDV
ncbi:sulfotransferase family protein [Luteimonas deserti]|nr:sulfotransferase [Luteimonas deserti]